MPPKSSDSIFSPIENELPLRGLRRLGLVPPDGLGTVRRAVFLALLSWLPIIAWAGIVGHLGRVHSDESLLMHFGVHVRCLVAIPLLILAEAPFQRTVESMVRQFRSSGLVQPELEPRFAQVGAEMRHLRDLSMPWILVLGAAFAWSIAGHPTPSDDAVVWALRVDGGLGFGGWWFAYVVRAIFVALVLAWFWRIVLVTWCLWRIGQLGLSLVPTHPDRAGGLSFIEKLPGAFGLVTFVLSATVSSHWAHEIVAHGATLESFRLPGLLFVLLWSLCMLAPMLVLAPPLIAARAHALPAYAALVGQQGRLVHKRWILGEAVDDDAPMVEAPGIGVIADASAMYENVKKLRFAPVGLRTAAMIVMPMVLPFLIVACMQVPLPQLLLNLAKALA